MDPSIMKLLEEDEDESMHSGADVEAFQAALNRDIGGDASTSQPSDSDNALSQGSNHTSSQSLPQWQNASQDQSSESQIEQDQRSAQQQEQTLSGMELKQHGSVIESQQQNTVPEELKHLQMPQKKSQDDCQQGKGHPTSLQNPQTTEMQVSEKIRTPIDEPDRRPSLEGESQYAKLQKMSNQQATITEQASNPINRTKPGQVPFGVLLPVLQAQLDKDRAMQLQTIFVKLKKNEIPKEGFVRLMRGIVGDHMLKLAVMKIQSQPSSNQFQLQSQASARQHPQRIPSVSASSSQFSDPHSFAQLHQKGTDSSADPSHIAVVQIPAGSSYPTIEKDAQKTREVNRQSDSHGVQVSQVSSSGESTVNQEREQSSITIQGLNKQQQQHLHFPPIYGSTGGNYHPYSGTNVNTSTSSVKPQPHDTQLRQISQHQNLSSTQLGGTTQGMNMMSLPKFERQSSINDPKRVQGGSVSHLANNSTSQQKSVPWQSSSNKEQYSAPSSSVAGVKQEIIDQATEPHFSHSQGLSCFSSAQLGQGNATPGIVKDETLEKQSSRMGLSTSTSMMPSNSVSPSMTTQLDPNVPLGSRIPSTAPPSVTNARTPSKKPSIGQKKPLEALGSSPTLPSSKKQKVSGTFSDQSIEQLNDVTAVSGVNLREEEEQLFSGPKEDSRASEASRRVVQEEEERLILQKTPLQKKLAEIMTKCGLKSISNDVERCLSLCVEERMRGLISNLIRLSRQRVDIEKPRHRTLITLDVGQQIMTMNRKAREEWEKKQAEAERLRRLNEPEGNNGVDGEKEKDEGRAKSLKVNKEEDDKMRTTAANVAARAAVGGDDMLSKWQLMAEQARQKREGGVDASGSQPGKDASRRPTSGRKDNQEAEKKGNAGAVRKFGRNQVVVPQTRVAPKISIKDVIAILEREPQMSRSTLIYRLYERIHSDAAVE